MQNAKQQGELMIIVTLNNGRTAVVKIEGDKNVMAFREAIKGQFMLKGPADLLKVRTPDKAGEELAFRPRLVDALRRGKEDGANERSAYVDVSEVESYSSGKRQTIHQLLSQLIAIDADVVRTMELRFGSAVTLAVARQDPLAALDCYEMAKALPGPSTKKGWSQKGVLVCNEYWEFASCLFNGKPGMIKGLDQQEAARQKAAELDGVEFSEEHHLVPFTFLEAKEGFSIVMPYCNLTLHELPAFNASSSPDHLEVVTRIACEMKIALDYLHSKGYAHCDVKPANIFLNANGTFLLGDHGSVAKFGLVTQSTQAFMPRELLPPEGAHQRSSASLDWWMLAITLLEKCGLRAGGWGGLWSKAEIKEDIALFAPFASVHAMLDTAELLELEL